MGDVCVSGPNTRNYTWTDWTEWSDCSVSCGGTGEKTRTRDCVGPVHGGLECPSPNETETDSCDAPACWTEFSEWSACEGMCGSTGSQSRTRSCIEPTEGGEPFLRSPTRPTRKSATPLGSGQALSISHRCKKINVDSCSRGFGRMIAFTPN